MITDRLGELIGNRGDEIVVPGASSEVLTRWALPITNVTAMVSPSARPSPSMMPPTTPVREYGTHHLPDHFPGGGTQTVS